MEEPAGETGRGGWTDGMTLTPGQGEEDSASLGSDPAVAHPGPAAELQRERAEFDRLRRVLCVVLGVLTRLSFLTSFGEEYVQVCCLDVPNPLRCIHTGCGTEFVANRVAELKKKKNSIDASFRGPFGVRQR